MKKRHRIGTTALITSISFERNDDMKKRLLSFIVTLAILASMVNIGTPFVSPAMAAGGNVTIIASQDAYVQGSSQTTVAKGKDDPNNLNGRDWSDKPGAPSAYMLPYLQFEIPSADEFENIDDINSIKLKIYCLSGKKDEYVVGLSNFESFDENTITYNQAMEKDKAATLSNRLNFDQDGFRIEGSEVAFASVINEWLEFDITSKIKQLISENTSGERKSVVLTVAPRSRESFPELSYHGSVVFCSKEYQNGAYAPRIEINANSRIVKSQSAISDFYNHPDMGDVESDVLNVSAPEKTYIDFGNSFDVSEQDVIAKALVKLYMLPFSQQPFGIRAYTLSDISDETGEEISDINVNGSVVEFDVTQKLAECANEQKNLIIRVESDNGESVPLVFSSSRNPDGISPELEYELVYQGNVSYFELNGEEEIEISLEKATKYQYSVTGFDQYGEVTDCTALNIEYALDEAPTGVSISKDGLLTVSPEAMPGVATVRATYTDMPEINGTMDVEIKMVPPHSMEIKGGITAKLPKEGFVMNKPYYVELYTQNDIKMPVVTPVEWSVSGPASISIEGMDEGNANVVIDNTDGSLNIGDQFEILAKLTEYPDITAKMNVTIGEKDQVYTQIIIPASQDTYIKKADYATNGNNNSNELLAKHRAVTPLLPNVTDYFTQEGTNRETYLMFDGLSILPKDIISATIVLTTNKDFNETASAPQSGMPKANIYKLSDTSWSETKGSIKSRLPVEGKAVATAAYATSLDSKTKFDITDAMKDILESGDDKVAFRVGMEPIRNNNYTHNYYSKDATVQNPDTGEAESIPNDKKPTLILSASYVREPKSLSLIGEDKAGIMLEDTVFSYELCLTDQFGQQYTDEEMKEYTVNLSLKEDYQGVSFEDGILTVYPEAPAQTVTICAGVEEFPDFDTEFDIELYRAKAANLEISGPDTIQMPSDDYAVYATYEIKVYDQFGNKVNIPDSVYELSEPQIGVSIDSKTGVVSVENYAVPNREICIVAYSSGNRSIYVEKEVRILPVPQQTGKEKHPNLLYSNEDIVPLRTKINTEPFATYYNNLKQTADTYTADDLVFLAQTDPREDPDDIYDHAYPLVEVDEDGREKVLDRKRPWQAMTTDLFYTQGNFTFTPPEGTKYAKLQAVAKGQGITHFDKFTFKIESGNSIDLYNADMETGNQRYVDEEIEYQDGSQYQVIETSPSGWEYLNDVKTPMPEGWHYIRKVGSDSTFEWANQNYHQDKVASSGVRSAKIVNNTVTSYAGISTDKVSVKPGTVYVLSTGFGGNDKLIGEKGKLMEYEPLDKTAGLSMQVVYYDKDGNEIGIKNWEQTAVSNKPMNINWQVKPLRRSYDNFFDACCTIYAVTKNLDYAIKAKEVLKYQLEDMKWGMRYRTTTGYNAKMNDAYEAVHTGRTLQRDAVGYDMIYDSGVITPQEDKEIRDLFNWVAYELTSTAYYNYAAANGQIHNYNADRISALIMYALCFPDNEGTEANKYKDTFEFFYNHVMDENNVWSFPTMFKNGIYDAGDQYGGMWCENMRYHRSVLAGWLLAAKAVDRYDPSLNWLQREDLKKMSRMWVTAQGPRMVVSTNAKNLAGYPTVGDQSWRESIDMAAWCAGIYKITDPELSKELMFTWDRMGSQLGGAYPINILMDNDPTLPRKNPGLGSMYLNNVGYTYFRQNFDVLGQENMIIIPNSPGYGNKNNPVHDHHDRGSFAYFAKGTPMSLDSGMGAYFGSDTAFWRSSRSHNVVLFWSDSQGEWLSNAGGDGNSYTSDTGKTRYYDSETKDFYTSSDIDRVTINVNPETRGGKETNMQWNRHFAYIKDGIDALIYWDEVKNTRKSQYNLFMASRNYTQDGDMVVANMNNNMQMEVHLLGSDNPDISSKWVPSSGAYGIPTINGEEQQQLIQFEQSNGKDYLTVLYAKQSGAQGLVSTELETGNDSVTAYRMEQAQTGKAFYVVVNESSSDETFNISNDNTLRNPQTNQIINANEDISIEKGKMVILVDDSIQKSTPQRMELSGDSVVGVPYGGDSLKYQYDARVFDQYGSTVDNATPVYEVTGGGEYAVIDNTGELTLLPGFENGSKITVKATYEGIETSMDVVSDVSDTKITSVDIEGSNTLVVPHSGSYEYGYRAVFKNASGAPVSGATPLWTLINKKDGVTLNSYTGALCISDEVESGTIIHINVSHYNDPSINKTLEIIITDEKETGIYVNAPQQFAITSGKESTLKLSGYVTNQQGEKFDGSGITYSLKDEIDGVSVSEDGVITISGSVKSGGEIIVVAKSNTNERNKKEYVIKLVDNDICAIVLDGASTIDAQKSNVYVTYTAKVVDKNGTPVDKEVEWSISGHSSVSVDNGVVTVKPGAISGTATLTATLKGNTSVYAEMEIKINPYTEIVGGNVSTSGGFGGSGGAGGGAPNPGTTPVVPQGSKFTDLPQSHWAYEYVTELVNCGAVNGKTNTTFEPETNITRAEFVKILVTALGLEGTGKQVAFDDVKHNDWYYQSVAIATELKIVNGIDQKYFGANEFITREQMAAIIYRTMVNMGAKFELDQNKFADDNAISDYAKDAVMALKKQGILSGKGDNKFAPKDNTTRAESSKVISMVRNLAR